MAAGDLTPGRRRPPDTPFEELEPGDYRREGESVLWAVLPNGTICRVDHRWKLVEEDDGTITVGPLEPGGSHSIEVKGFSQKDKNWHGYLERGVWREV